MRKLLIGFVFVSALAAVPAFAVCTSPNAAAGAREWFAGASTYKFCDGTDWIAFSSAGTSSTCTKTAAMDYDSGNAVYQVCDGADWVKIGCAASMPPTGCATIGDTCSDGSVYAGLSPDGNVKMYTTAANTSSAAYWGTRGFTTGATSTVTGQANTANIYAHVQAGDGAYNPDDGSTPNALVLCEDLSANGHIDWYLPAEDELNVLYTNEAVIGGFTAPDSYWSSTEATNFSAQAQKIFNGFQGGYNKASPYQVRCVRKEGAGACVTCPDLGTCSAAGTVDYRSGDSVLAYCNGTNWVSMGPPAVDACACNPSPGDVCADGTVYAGLSPDGNVPMYTTAADASSSAYWGTYNYTTGETSAVTGKANSAAVYAHVQAGDGSYNPDDGKTPNALVLCEESTANGHIDWYLPAKNELNVLYTNKTAIGGFNVTSSGWYWSSTENDNSNAWIQRVSDGNQNINFKGLTHLVRCVRR